MKFIEIINFMILNSIEVIIQKKVRKTISYLFHNVHFKY